MSASAREIESSEGGASAIDLFCFYAYGYKGRAMYAIRAPFATPESGEGLVGRLARVQGKICRIVSISRQTGGPIAAGDPLGVEVSPVEPATALGPQE